MRQRFDFSERWRTIDRWSKRRAGSLPVGKHLAQLRTIELVPWPIIEKLFPHKHKPARSFTIRRLRINHASQWTEHVLRSHLIPSIFLDGLDNRDQRSQWSNVIVAYEPSQHHLLISLVQQP